MSISKRISLRQVAAAAGVSHSTVSLALRAHPSIPQQTRNRICELAKTMGYRPDPMLTALNIYRQARRGAAHQATLAWLNAFRIRDSLRLNPDCTLYFQGASERAREAGFNLQEFWLYEKGMTPQRISQIFHSRQIQGILLPPMPLSDTHIDLPWEHFSTVALGYSHKPVFHVVANAQYRSVRCAVANLHALGYRRIGLFTWMDQEERTDSNFLSGFNCECDKRGIPALHCRVDSQLDRKERDAIFYERWREQTQAWIRQQKPDALLLPDPLVAQRIGLPATETIAAKSPQPEPKRKGAGKAQGGARKTAVAQPAIGVLAHYAAYPQFAGIDQNAKATGAAAVDHLIHMIQRNERGKPELPLRILVEGIWRQGASAPQSNASASQSGTAARSVAR